MSHPQERRRLLGRVLSRGLAGVPLLVTAAHTPALAGMAQTASAYGSVMTSVQPGQLVYRSDPFALTDALNELRAKMNDEAKRLSQSTSLLGALVGLVKSLLDTLLGLVDSLFKGTLSVPQLRLQSPDLYRFVESYRSALWPLSPTAAFSTAIGNLQSYGPKTLLDVALDTSSPLGRYFVCAQLNAAAGSRIDPVLLTPNKVSTIAYELNTKGYFEPTAGVRWDSAKVLDWWKASLNLNL